MPQIPVTISGNLAVDPEFKTFSTGTTLTKLRIASSRRARVRVTKPAASRTEPAHGFSTLDDGHNGTAANAVTEEFQWTDVDNLFIDADCWGELATNAYASLKKGMPVVASGYLVTETWEAEELTETGPKKVTRSKIKLRADQVSFEMSRFQLSSAKSSNASHTPDGVPRTQVRTAEQMAAENASGNAAETPADTPADAYVAAAESASEEPAPQF